VDYLRSYISYRYGDATLRPVVIYAIFDINSFMFCSWCFAVS